MLYEVITISFSILFLSALFPLKNSAQNQSVTFGASYTGDVVSNLSGGMKTGTTYLGMATLQAGLDTENVITSYSIHYTKLDEESGKPYGWIFF